MEECRRVAISGDADAELRPNSRHWATTTGDAAVGCSDARGINRHGWFYQNERRNDFAGGVSTSESVRANERGPEEMRQLERFTGVSGYSSAPVHPIEQVPGSVRVTSGA
jgi:hypothetical protein